MDFWRRWHISFSTWLRDYIQERLPQNRRKRPLDLLHLHRHRDVPPRRPLARHRLDLPHLGRSPRHRPRRRPPLQKPPAKRPQTLARVGVRSQPPSSPSTSSASPGSSSTPPRMSNAWDDPHPSRHPPYLERRVASLTTISPFPSLASWHARRHPRTASPSNSSTTAPPCFGRFPFWAPGSRPRRPRPPHPDPLRPRLRHLHLRQLLTPVLLLSPLRLAFLVVSKGICVPYHRPKPPCPTVPSP